MDPSRLPEPDEARSRATALIRERSFFREKIVLASGRESDFYFDMKPTMFHPEGAALLAVLIFDRLSGLKVDYAGGLAVGAIPLLGPLSMLSFMKGRPIAGFFVRKEIKQHGTKRLVEGLRKGESLAGRQVAILEDVTTTGSSAMMAVKAAQDAGATVSLVLSTVDRQEGAEAFYAQEGIAFASLFKASAFLAG